MLKLAARTGRAKPSAIMVIAETAKQLKAEGKDVVNFSIGVPNFLPGDHVYQAVRDWMPRDSGGYGSNRGAPMPSPAFFASPRHTCPADRYMRQVARSVTPHRSVVRPCVRYARGSLMPSWNEVRTSGWVLRG